MLDLWQDMSNPTFGGLALHRRAKNKVLFFTNKFEI